MAVTTPGSYAPANAQETRHWGVHEYRRGTMSIVNVLILAGQGDRIRQHLDEHPEELRAHESDTWLAQAAETGNLDLVKEFHARGIGVNEPGRGPVWRSPLEVAVEYPDIVDWLLERGADASHPGVMAAAASRASAETVKRLLAAGGDVTVRSGYPPRNAYEQALQMGRSDVARLLHPTNPAFDAEAMLRDAFGALNPPPEGIFPPGAPFGLMIGENDGCPVCSTVGLSRRPMPGIPYRVELFVRLPWIGRTPTHSDVIRSGQSIGCCLSSVLGCAGLFSRPGTPSETASPLSRSRPTCPSSGR